jgi:pimeloyl-ACP methyl ester carboxylesterase
MGGMLQVEVLPKAGHAIQEDAPDAIAEIFAKIVKRYRRILEC